MRTIDTTTARVETQISERIETWAKALRAKDLEGAWSHYAPDVFVYDIVPPLEHRGEALRRGLAEWFLTFEGSIGYEVSDLGVTAGGDLAFTHGLSRITGKRIGGDVTDVWARLTMCFRKIGGEWMIVHEHYSVLQGRRLSGSGRPLTPSAPAPATPKRQYA
jgi:ketosteroid isomerase-like protein